MTSIESKTVNVARSQQDTFEFLSDLNNIGSLMPDQVEDWECDGETCSFKIKGMASLGMEYQDKTPSNKIVLREKGKSPFPFNLICNIGDGDSNCDLNLVLEAELNPMMEMLAKKPLKNFLDLLVTEFQNRSIA